MQAYGRWILALGMFFVFLAAGAAVLVQCPPIWRDYDGLIQISTRPNDMTILQYPAAYPFFSRMHVYVVTIVEGWLHHHKTTIDIWKGVPLNDGGIRALMISQQMALALALTAFVLSVARARGARWCLVIFLISNASLFVIANLISTEALAEALIVALVALSCWLFQAPKLSWSGLVAYGACLYLAIMTRHTNAIFAMLAPVAYLLRIVLEAMRRRGVTPGLWMAAGLFVVVGAASIGAADGTTRLLCRVFEVPYRSISARATSERLGFVKRMTPVERDAFLADLVNRSDDPVVKEAIPALARPASWVQQRAEIETILTREQPALEEEALTLKADAYLEQVTDLFFATRNRHLVEETGESIWRAFAETNSAEVNAYYLHTGAWSLDLYASHPQFSKKTQGLKICQPEAKRRIVAFESNAWLGLWRWVPHGAVLLAGALLAMVQLGCRVGDARRPILALATVATGVFATCLTFVYTNYNPRFTAVADLFGFLAVAMVAAHGWDSRRGDSEAATH